MTQKGLGAGRAPARAHPRSRPGGRQL